MGHQGVQGVSTAQGRGGPTGGACWYVRTVCGRGGRERPEQGGCRGKRKHDGPANWVLMGSAGIDTMPRPPRGTGGERRGTVGTRQGRKTPIRPRIKGPGALLAPKRASERDEYSPRAV